MTELALIKLTRPETASDTTALLSRIERLERGQPRPVVAEPPMAVPRRRPPSTVA